MKFFKKLKSSNFWVSMISAIVLIAQSVFNFEISSEHSSQIVLAILGVLVMSGIISDNSNSEVQLKSSSNSVEVEEFLDKIAVTIKNCVGGVISSQVQANTNVVEQVVEQSKTQEIAEIIATEQVVEPVVTNVIEVKEDATPVVTVSQTQPVTSITPEVVASTEQPRDVL